MECGQSVCVCRVPTREDSTVSHQRARHSLPLERGEERGERREGRDRTESKESRERERGTAGPPSVRGQHGLTAGAEYIDLQKTGSSSRRHGVGFW